MKSRKVIAACIAVYVAATVFVTARLAVQNASLRKENATLRALAESKAAVRRPKMDVARRPPRPQPPVPSAQGPASPDGKQPPTSTHHISESAIDAAVKARLEARRKQAEEERERRREEIASMTPEQKAAQKDAFLEKMRERSQRRLKAFVAKTGLNQEQAAAFESTVAAMDATLRETANAYAEQIRKTGTFSRDAQVKFVGDVSAVVSAGYGEMDASLPESWRTDDGNVNLMEIVGPEALSSVVEALTESGLEDGLQTVGQVMGGPEGGPDGGDAGGAEAGAPSDGMQGIESPGVGGGPGGGGPR
jgi:hypothetical protein